MEQSSEKETKQLHNTHNDDEIEIDLIDLLRKVIDIRKKIYKATGIGLIIGVIIAISIPKQYTVEVTLSPEMGVMEFGIVRNNIYRLSVNKIAGLGSGEPFIDPDQPDEYKAELDINFNVFPWAVRNQDVELE